MRFHPDLDRIIKPASLVLLASVCLVLSALGGAAGLMLSAWATSALVSMSLPMDIPVSIALPTDWRLLAFTGGLSLLTGLAFGILPALRASRPDLVPALKDEGALGTPGRRFGLRQGLVVTQVAVSVVLLVGGLLLTRSLMKALDTDPGFVAGGLVTATISLDLHGYEDTRGQQFFERAMASARQLLRSGLVGAGSENGPDVDSGGRSYRLLSSTSCGRGQKSRPLRLQRIGTPLPKPSQFCLSSDSSRRCRI